MGDEHPVSRPSSPQLDVQAEASRHRQRLIAAAKAGGADAQSRLGDIYRVGDEHTKQDYAEALRWYRAAAEQGDANAENNLGAMHEHAMGVPENVAEAARWYRRAPARGLAAAQYNLALLLGWGRGVPMDEPEATALLHKSASQGYIPACSVLGTLYRHGDYVEKRIPIAAEFHVIAALEGDREAIDELAAYHMEIEAEALNGSLLASLCLAKMFDRGLGVEADKVKEFAWLLWGRKCGTLETEIDVRGELEDMREFYATILSAADRAEARRLVRSMKPRGGKTSGRRRNGG